jgi:phosphatidylglycerophosphate synthase
MATTTEAKESLQKFFHQGLEWLAASSLGSVIYFAVMRDTPRFLISVALAFVLLLGVAFQKFVLRDPSNAPLSASDGRQSSRFGYIAANFLTFLRPGIGIAAGISIAHRQVTLGFLLFLAGLTSDVLDGLIARMFEAQSPSGRAWDAIADVIHNFAFGFGVAWFAVGPPFDIARAVTLGIMVATFVASRFFVSVHSVADKCLSGAWRVLLFSLTLTLLPAEWRIAGLLGGLVLAVLGGTYELGVIRNEVVGGTRKWI